MIQSIKNEYFEQIITIMEDLVVSLPFLIEFEQNNVIDEEGYYVINIILKIYLEGIHINSFVPLDKQQFKRWIQIFIVFISMTVLKDQNVLALEYPTQSKYNLNDKENYILTKCKKNTYKCIYKLQTRYFMNSYVFLYK